MSYTVVPNDYPLPGPEDTTEENTHHSLTYLSSGRSVVEARELARSGSPPSMLVHDTDFETIRSDKPKAPKSTNRRGKARRIVRTLWLTVFLPAVAFAYLAFCYVAATRLVPVRIWMVDQPMEHVYGIKAGVTTINIIVVAIALLPLKSLLDDIKASLTKDETRIQLMHNSSEEFFRALHKSTSGIPLKDINNVSIPSHTLLQGVRSVVQNRASKYYAGAIVSGVMAAIISSLAPAALSVGLIATDSEITAIQVGAIKIDSVIDVGELGASELFKARTGEAASRGWVQNVLGAEIAFTPTSPRYAVPVPLNIEPPTRARYLTDVVILDPVCSWAIPDAPLAPFLEDYRTYPSVWVNLTSPGVGIIIDDYYNYWVNKKYLNVAGSGSVYLRLGLKNLTTSDPITDGTMAWIIAQCVSCSFQGFSSLQSALDLSDIPTREFSFNKTDSSNVTTLYTTRFSTLVCKPRASVETREVVLDGDGKLQVLENTGGLVRQGNLHFGQTQLMLAYGLLRYPTDSGPETDFTDMGRAAQVQMFFGSNLGNSTTTPVLKPQSIEQITAQYRLAQQAALRSYLSGEIASAYVPGRVQITKLVFTSSLPHIIVSTILFALVALFINLCYLRSDMEQFTLFSVATVLARSNVGAICEDAKYATGAEKWGTPDSVSVRRVEDRRVYLTHNGGPGPSLHME